MGIQICPRRIHVAQRDSKIESSVPRATRKPQAPPYSQAPGHLRGGMVYEESGPPKLRASPPNKDLAPQTGWVEVKPVNFPL